MTATWLVRYTDGSELAQFDRASPAFVAAAGEVPYHAIDWPRVEELCFASAHVEERFAVALPPEGYRLSLRSRHTRTVGGDQVMCFLLLVTLAGAEPSNETVVSATYWFPDGTMHTCPHFNCPDVARYARGQLLGAPVPLAAATEVLSAAVDSQLGSPSPAPLDLIAYREVPDVFPCS